MPPLWMTKSLKESTAYCLCLLPRGDARRSGDAPVVRGGRAGRYGQRLLAGRAIGVDEVRELLAAQRLLPHQRRGNGVERDPVVAQRGARTLVRLLDQAVYRRVDAPRRPITVLPGLPRTAGAVTRHARLV